VGQGKTPIKETLQLLKKEKWPIFADIELNTDPPGSTSSPKLPKCVNTARKLWRKSPLNEASCFPPNPSNHGIAADDSPRERTLRSPPKKR